MGARLFGFRKPINDNTRRGLDEVPIRAEDWRHPPGATKGDGFVMGSDVWSRSAGTWYCAVTVPQGEYRCADGLTEAEVMSYVPTETLWTVRIKGRERLKVQSQRPLWRGYSFFRIANECDWSPIYARDAFGRSRLGIIGVIGAGGAPTAIAASKLRSMADEEREGWFDDRRRPALIAGRDAKPLPAVMKDERVRITAGAFTGYEGIAENDNDKASARVTLGIFGQATVATISLGDLENLTRPQLAGVALRRA